jgi:coenzyme PQQ precursor peptide PqqA
LNSHYYGGHAQLDAGPLDGAVLDSAATGGREMKKWSKPRFQNLRYGFEINLYVTVR